MSEVTRRRLERSASAIFMCALLLVGVVLVFWGTSARAKQLATLNVLFGTVEVRHGDGAFEPGREGEALREGDTIRTGADGRASIEYFDGSLTRIDLDTMFSFVELSTIDEVPDSKVIVGEQPLGNSFNRVVELTDPQSRFDIVTPTLATSVTGSVYAVFVAEDGSTTIAVIEGTVIAIGTEGDDEVEVEVTEGTMLVTEADGSVGDPQEIPETVLESDWIEYNECELDQGPGCLPVVPGEPEPPVASEDPTTEQPGEETPPPTTGTDPGTDPGDDTGGGSETTPPPPPPPPPVENQPPQASFTASPLSGQAPLTVGFSDTSTDPEGGALARGWTFGDGSSASGGKEQEHTYSEPGTYTVTLTVTDPKGQSDSMGRVVTVKPDTTAPVVAITDAPDDPSDSADATFAFTTSETGSGFICVLDGATQACGEGGSGSVGYTDLAEGAHVFSVSVTDRAGNTGSASHAWTIEIPPVLDHIVISPALATIQVGGAQTYTAEAIDTDGLSMGEVTADTTFSIAPGGSCTGASCTAAEPGEFTVTGTYQGSSDTADLTVVPAFDHIVISPHQATILLGEAQAYTAEAFDADGLSIGDVTADTTFSIAPSGTCTAAACTADEPGEFTVTGTYLGTSDEAELTVRAAPKISLAFDWQPDDVLVGEAFSVKVVVMDEDGPVDGAGCLISIALGDNEEGATLSGDTGPKVATSSRVIFTGLSVNKPGGYALVAGSANCSALVTSEPFEVEGEGSNAQGDASEVALGLVLLLPLLGLGGWRLRLALQGPDRDLGFGPKRS